MRRTSPECGTTPPSRFLQALLLLLFVAAPLPDCSAALINTNTSSVLTRNGRAASLEEGDVHYQNPGIYPGVVLFNIHGQYHMRLTKKYEGSPANFVIKFERGTTIMAMIPATADKNLLVLRFEAFPHTFSGMLDVTALDEYEENSFRTVDKYKNFDCMPFGETKATMTAEFRYYGFPIQVSAKLPSGFTPSRYLLVLPSTNCLDVLNCEPREGCHIIQGRGALPPPGTYNLCVTTNYWGDRYLPWGQSSVDVTALVSMPLTLAVGRVPSITLFEAHTGRKADGSEEWRRVLVRCTTDTCPTVRDQKGAEIIDVSVCNANAIEDGVIISVAELDVPPGVYALCVVDGGSYASPPVFSVKVVPTPFSMTVMESSDDFVVLEVTGGDIGHRIEPYAICIAEDFSPCWTVTSNDDKCTTAADPNAMVVSVDVRSVVEKDKMTFCLISGSVSYNDITYRGVLGERKYKEVSSTEKLNIWAVMGIVVALLVFSILSVTIIVCCLKRRKKNDETFPVGENRRSANNIAPSAHSASQSILVGGGRSGYGEEFYSWFIQPVYASNNSLTGGPQEERCFTSSDSSWVQN